jgi:hypothetical protein
MVANDTNSEPITASPFALNVTREAGKVELHANEPL